MYSVAHRRTQCGSTLLISLVFLMIFAVMAAATYRNSLTSVQAIGNMQWRSEAIMAANDAIDRLLSTADFATNTAVTTQQVNTAPFAVDANDDGITDITVNFPVVTLDGVARAGPRCLRAEPIPNQNLNPTLDADIGCFGSGAASNSGLAVATSAGGTGTVSAAPSLCSNTEWSITMRAVDTGTATSVDVVQGVGVRVPTTAIPACD